MTKTREQKLNVPYEPVSQGHQLGVHIPVNMAFEMRKALHEIVRTNGDIDEYVRQKLKYDSKYDLFKVLAAEQIDAVAIGIDQIEKGDGMIIGDQTGIGKGRQAAAIIRYGILNGYAPVFVTESPNLFSDMYRDLVDIDSAHFVPLIINTAAHAHIKDENGHIIHKAKSDNQQLKALIGGKTTMPAGYDFVMVTYSQLESDQYAIRNRGVKIKRGYKYTDDYKPVFIRNIAENNIFILDESHNAGGLDSIKGFYIRNVTQKAQGAIYLSATYAKSPKNMPLYAVKTAMKEANLPNEALINAIQKGGLALQEIISAQLVQSGQMVRRQRTYEGIKVTYKTLTEAREKHIKIYDIITGIIRDIIAFQNEHVSEVITGVRKQVEAAGGEASETSGTKNAGVNNTPYFSKIFNVVSQLLFSLKAEEVAQEAIKQLNANKKVVIAFKSTMGSFLSDFGFQDGEKIGKIDFSATLMKGLEGVMKYSVKQATGHVETKIITRKDLSLSGQLAYDEIEAKIKKASSGISISPIDVIIDLIEKRPRPNGVAGTHKYYRVAEVTGRNQRISNITGKAPYITSFKSDVGDSFRDFNQGTADVLLVNVKGATGASAHASSKFKDQRQRVMIIHQPELDINKEVQKRGRVNRTGQIVLPEYIYVSSAIPAEKRLMMMLQAKLKSLDANTTGSQKTSEAQLKSDDFLNKYGDVVVSKYVMENQEFNEQVGYPLAKKKDSRGPFKDPKEDAANKVTRRVAILPVAQQEGFYQDILLAYNHYINKLLESGEYDLEASYLDLQAATQESFVIIEGKGGYSPFGHHTLLEKCRCKVLRKPMKREEIEKQIAKQLDGMTPKQYNNEIRKYYDQVYPGLVEARLDERYKKVAAYQKALDALSKNTSPEEAGAKEKEKQSLLKKIEETKITIGKIKDQLEGNGKMVMSFLSSLYLGKVTRVPFEMSEAFSYGIVVGIKIDKKLKNPFRPSNVTIKIAVADGRRLIEVPLSSSEASRYKSMADLIDAHRESEVFQSWDTLYSQKDTEERYIITGNILQAIGDAKRKGKLVKFSDHQGQVRNGILLKVGFGKKDGDFSASKPITAAIDTIYNLSIGEEFSAADGRVRFKNKGAYFEVYVRASGEGHQFYSDPDLRKLLQLTQQEKAEGETMGKFLKAGGNDMVGVLPKPNLKAFCVLLSNKHAVMVSGAAQKIEKPKQKQDNKAEPLISYRYELQTPFRAGGYPLEGFMHHEQVNGSAYGHIIFDRTLSPKERINYSLIPVFSSGKEAIRHWRLWVLGQPIIKTKLKELIGKQKNKHYESAIQNLGFFITNNAHEAGNKEFVFGHYTEKELGAALYKETIGKQPVTLLDQLIDAVKIELEAT